ncbi:unnamed protein product [Periconia digitata]|uniref:Rhodopsin domain-containing protein n=1 Tax=Periconia digitata TaxID=1303443 RepID=A0A9W4XT84_9PLEO|nr:unnamed protein product [Periconia digitata]
MMSNSPTGQKGAASGTVLTSGVVIPLTAFYVLNWFFSALVIIAFFVRAYIRYASFKHLLLEDYLMLFALLLHFSGAILIQLFIEHAYDIEAVGKGDFSKIGPDFIQNSQKAFIATGASLLLAMIGVLVIKLNFLIFFRRLGQEINRFGIAWWLILIFTVSCTIVSLAISPFGCMFGKIEHILSPQCTGPAMTHRVLVSTVFSSATDAASDLMIVALPVVILWKSHIERRKKVILSLVFGLVFLTIAITIVRGSVFSEVYSQSSPSGKAKTQSGSFTWFWFYCQFSVAYLIACIISFRTLFVQRRNEAEKRDQMQKRREQIYKSAARRGLRAKAQHLHNTLLETCKSLEGVSSDEGLSMHRLPSVPTGLMTVNFNDDGNWRRAAEKDDRSSHTSSD